MPTLPHLAPRLAQKLAENAEILGCDGVPLLCCHHNRELGVSIGQDQKAIARFGDGNDLLNTAETPP